MNSENTILNSQKNILKKGLGGFIVIPIVILLISIVFSIGLPFYLYDDFLSYDDSRKKEIEMRKRCYDFFNEAGKINYKTTDFGDSFDGFLDNICDALKRDGKYCEEECVDGYFGNVIGL